jgi:hypothetical protein
LKKTGKKITKFGLGKDGKRRTVAEKEKDKLA